MTVGRDQFDRPVERAFERLRETPAAPDVTRRVMGRLGYMRVSDPVARRHRRRRWIRRGVCIAVMAVTAGAGWRTYDTSSAVRAPAEMTVPGAIILDAHQRQMQFRSLFQSIQLQTPAPQPADDSPVQSSQEQSWPTDDVNRSAGAPGQWV